MNPSGIPCKINRRNPYPPRPVRAFCAWMLLAALIPCLAAGMMSPASAFAQAGPETPPQGAPAQPPRYPGMGKLVFNFDNADLAEVVRTLADLLRINYVLDPGVGGKVSIHTAGELDQKDLFPIFYQILEINGLTAVKRDGIYNIVPLKDASRLPIPSRQGGAGPIPAGDRVVIQVIRLNAISPEEIAKVITPFVSPEGSIVSQENASILVVVDKADNLRKILRLVEVFDTDLFARVNYRFFPIQHGDVEEMAETLDKLLTAYGPSVKAGVTLIPIVRLNTLLAVGSQPGAMDEIARFIQKYDLPNQGTAPSIYYYPVKNGRAADIAGILNQVFTGQAQAKTDKKTGAVAFSRNPLSPVEKVRKEASDRTSRTAVGRSAAAPSSPSTPSSGITGGPGDMSGTLSGEVRITEDESRNSLIIEATPADYQIVKNLLTQLDIVPRQVLIEVTIAEVGLDESSKMGVEWTYLKGDESMSTSLIKAQAGSSGLQALVGNPGRWTATLSALASDNKVNILSSPTILASNSMPATIDISTEIPIASSQYQYTSDLNSGLMETSIEYRDTGVMLTVTPNINELGLVTMDISQEVSEQAPNVTVGDKEYPSFYKRSAETTLTVQSGQTIVIGGLIRENRSNGAAGIPWLVSVPMLRWLFGKQSDSYAKTELIIMISPYVIDDFDDVDAVTREFKKKTRTLYPEG